MNKQKQVDDYPYGGGRGAVMQADPLYRCWKHITDEAGGPVHTIYLSPAGRIFRQEDAKRLSRDYNRLILVCGHYEGIDERFIEACVDEEISLGDFVLTGGEIPAMAVADAVCRLVPGFCPMKRALPMKATGTACWNIRNTPPRGLARQSGSLGFAVRPPCQYCQMAAKTIILRTRQRRPDLYEKLDLSSKADQKLLKELEDETSPS